MNMRKLNLVFNRLQNLPSGLDFIKYSWNKVINISKRVSMCRTVAHPSAIMLEVTNYCNLHCITCPREYQYGSYMEKGSMDLDLLKNIVDQVYPYVDSIGLTGLGEPLLYSDLPEALKYIKSKNKGIITSVSTNAALPDTLAKIKVIKEDIDSIQISIDGIGDTYNRVRKNGNYKEFLQNVRGIRNELSASKKDLIFNMVVIKDNFYQMADMIDLTQKLGISCLNFTLFNLASVTEINIEYYKFFHTTEFLDALNNAIEQAKKYPDLHITFWDYRSKNSFRKCHFPWTQFYISWDGYVTACCAKPFPKELHFGNLNNTSLIDCLNSASYQQFRKLWYQNHAPKFCDRCHFIEMKPIKQSLLQKN